MKMVARSGSALVLAVMLAGAQLGFAAEALKSPINLAAPHAAETPAGRLACPTPVALPKAVETTKYYIDKKSSVADPTLYSEEMQREQPIRKEDEAIARAMSRLLSSGAEEREAAAECILSHLKQFTADDAFNETAQFRGSGVVRLLSLTPVLAYVALKQENRVGPDDRASIEAWIRRLANSIVSFEEKYPYGNNISYWGGATLAFAAVALDERKYLDHALAIARQAGKEIDGRGVLPKEMARGARAFEYSLFATQALASIAVVADANGVPLAKPGDPLRQLMATMAAAVVTPRRLVELGADEAAIDKKWIYAQNLGWLVYYRQVSGDRSVDGVLCAARPLFSFRSGGDWLALYGKGDLCFP